MNGVIKNIFLFSLLAVLLMLMPGFSNAEISFQQSQLSNPSGILENLPQPLNDFVKSARDIGVTAGSQFGKYINTSAFQGPINVNLNQLKDIDVTQNGLYQLAVKLFTSVGNLFVWILNIVIDLIKQILSFVH
ncbi:MAG: hypothetical protein A3B13_03425 [Candidatus Liptonbacteria bacterium RIFCSPLOWO2_01_FULL_45_15]|uniref:Uncharacterized protein n=1 Tax=Candidatus Liptonbacteria bacterium RIFCSPLOWO2_01_FULL_45_15 TaxID=1798649 RepID=A0A1G2CCA7_9BACT|nr:MAG: hypothetical protein A3B13_03425 [Candidatus Liptonbacteria bacterium RIFCSPLOWO2_01_FULL_45_15]